MVQLEIISGKSAGASLVTRRFPVLLGRSPEAQVLLEEPGVWNSHAQIDFVAHEGFFLRAEPNALTAVNGQAVAETLLRNGDVISLGGAQVRFWLAPARQRGLLVREGVFWALLVAVSLGQIALIYALLQAMN